MVRVLILVDKQIFEPAVKFATYVGTVPQHKRNLDQQIVKIHRVVIVEYALITGIYFGDLFQKVIVCAIPYLFGRLKIVLEVRYYVKHASGGKVLRIGIGGFDRVFYASLLILIVVDTKVAVEACSLSVPSKELNAKRMESADMRPFRRCAHRLKSISHLLCSFVGKSYGADIIRSHARINKRSYAADYNAGFSTARACDYQQWPVNVINCLTLRFRQILDGDLR